MGVANFARLYAVDYTPPTLLATTTPSPITAPSSLLAINAPTNTSSLPPLILSTLSLSLNVLNGLPVPPPSGLVIGLMRMRIKQNFIAGGCGSTSYKILCG